MEELGANPVKIRVIALYVPQVTGGAHDVLPGSAFRLEQAGNIAIGPPGLRAEIARMYGTPLFIDAGRSGDQKDGDTLDIQPQSA